jgi:hypothetical protein
VWAAIRYRRAQALALLLLSALITGCAVFAPLSHDAPVEVYPSALALGYTSTGKGSRLWSRVRWWLAA